MVIPPEALTSLGYILGGLLIVAIMQRGNLEKAVNKKIEQNAPQAVPVSATPNPMIGQASGTSADNSNSHLVQMLLERLSGEFDRERDWNHAEFSRVWDEIGTLKARDLSSKKL